MVGGCTGAWAPGGVDFQMGRDGDIPHVLAVHTAVVQISQDGFPIFHNTNLAGRAPDHTMSDVMKSLVWLLRGI